MHSWTVTKKLLWLTVVPVLATAALPKQQDPDHPFPGPVATVGNPRTPDTLGKEMADAYASGAHRIVIRSGTYNFALAHHALIRLDNWKDAKITSHGVTLVSSETEPGADLIHMSLCSNVQIDGLTLTQSWQTACQGKVQSVSQDGGKTACVWRPDAGFPSPDHARGPSVVDAKTRLLKPGIGDLSDAVFAPAEGGNYRVEFGRTVNVTVGDWLVAKGQDGPSKFDLVQCHGCILSNMLFQRNGPNTLREDGGGGNIYGGIKWQLGPKPDDATEKPIVSGSGDELLSTEAYPGPDIEECDFTGVQLGDCIRIHGFLQDVRSVNGESLVVSGSGGLKVGQPIRIAAPGFFANAFVKTLTVNADKTATITLDNDVKAPVGAKVSSPLLNGQSFKVLTCHIGFTRASGIDVKADEGLIQGNFITDCGGPGISAGPQYSFNESDYVQDLAIKDNQFLRNGVNGAPNAAIVVHGEGAKGNHNVTIEGNTFDSNYSGDFLGAWINTLTMEHNNFTSPSNVPLGLHDSNSIALTFCSDVRLLQNLFKNSSSYSKPVVLVDKSVEGFKDDPQSRG